MFINKVLLFSLFLSSTLHKIYCAKLDGPDDAVAVAELEKEKFGVPIWFHNYYQNVLLPISWKEEKLPFWYSDGREKAINDMYHRYLLNSI